MKLKVVLPIVVLITFLVHASYVSNGFTWLDHNDIESKQAIVSLNQIVKMLSSPFGRTAFYRPLVTLTYSIDSALYGTNAFGFHLTNLFLHIAVVCASLLFLKSFIKISLKEQILTALIIGIHPVTSIVVGSITQRQEPLVLTFIMLTVFFHAQYRKSSSVFYGALTTLSFLVALFSKETAVVVIPLLIIFWEIIQRKTSKKNNSICSKLYIVEAVVLASYLFVRFRFVPAVWGTQAVSLPFDQAIGTRLSLVSRSIGQLVSPMKPLFSDVVHVVSIFNPVNIGIVTLIIFSLYLLKRFGLKSVYGIFFVLFLILLAPGLNIIPVPRIGSPHYSYLPLIPFAGAVSILVWRSQRRIRNYLLVGSCVWIIIASFHTFIAGFHFKDDVSLFTPEITRDNNFLEGYQYLGDYYFFRNDLQKAETYYKKSLQKKSGVLAYVDKVSVLNNFAGVRLKQNRLEDADMLLSQITNPPLVVIYNRALIASRLGDHRSVVELLMKRLSLWKQAEPYLLLANSLAILGRDTEEITVLTTAMPYLSADQKKTVVERLKKK